MRIAVLILALALAGCGNPPTASAPAPPNSDAGLQRVVTALQDIAQVTGSTEASLVNANAQGLVSDQTTRVLLVDVFGRINTAVVQASGITRGIVKLAPADRGNLALILDPILQTVTADLNGGLVTITDAKTRQSVQLALATIQTTLASVELILANK